MRTTSQRGWSVVSGVGALLNFDALQLNGTIPILAPAFSRQVRDRQPFLSILNGVLHLVKDNAEQTGCRTCIVPANVDVPRTYTYLHDADHGWLIVSRTDLDAAGLSPGDFSPWGRVCGDSFALDGYGDMPKFLKRLDERGIRYRFHDRRTKGDAHVRQYWFPNEAAALQASKPSSGEEAQHLWTHVCGVIAAARHQFWWNARTTGKGSLCSTLHIVDHARCV
jgi:hypothetical protein